MNGWRGVSFANSGVAATEGADALVILTEWKEFRSPDFSALHGGLKHRAIFDGRNLFDPPLVEEAGMEYFCVGRTSARLSGE